MDEFLNKKPVRKILVIRFRRVGDAVLSSVLCSTLKRSFPEATIDYVLNDQIAPLFENHPDIDKLITFSNKELINRNLYLRKVRKIMKEGDYDMIVDSRTTMRTLFFSLFSLSTPYRIGIKKIYNFLHNMQTSHPVHHFPKKDEIDLKLALLKPLEKIFPINYDKNFKLYITDKEKADFKTYMANQGIDFTKPVLVCGATTRDKTKRWNIHYMKSTLLKIMNEHKDIQLIFNYVGNEKEDILEIYHQTGKPSNIFINVETNGLRDLMALLSNADFYFGNEGGTRHIAQALDIPAFAIYPSSVSKSQWLPNPNENNAGIEPADVCDIASLTEEEQNKVVTPDEVWKRLHPMLSRVT